VIVLGVDGGDAKTELVVASADGELLHYVRGPGSSAYEVGADAYIDVVADVIARTGLDGPVEHGAFLLCDADIPEHIAELSDAVARQGLVQDAIVENDAFALLRIGSGDGNAVAVACGAWLSCIGRAADGRIVRYPDPGWQTGTWGGSETFGRRGLFFAVRAEDGRSDPTALVDIVRTHFDAKTATRVGEAVHHGRLPAVRLAELAPAAITAAAAGDTIARRLVAQLADEIAVLATKALRDLGAVEADVVLGDGLLHGGLLVDEVAARLPAGACPAVVGEPPALGAALAGLDAAGAAPEAEARLRAAVSAAPAPKEL
jgi:N-acetylglucosamine kinase-like BadF-type ATPase